MVCRRGRARLAELDLEFAVGGETVAVVRPAPYRLPPDSPASGRTNLRWLIPALPDATGEVALRLTVHCANSQLAIDEIPGLHLLRGQVVAIDGEPSVLVTPDAVVV